MPPPEPPRPPLPSAPSGPAPVPPRPPTPPAPALLRPIVERSHRQRALIVEPAAAPARSSAAARAGRFERVGVPAASAAARTGAVARNGGVDQRQPALVVHATATASEAAVSAVAAGASATPARSPGPRRVSGDRDRIEDQRPTVEDAPAVAGGSSIEAIGSGTARGAADTRDAARPRRSGWCTPAGDAQAAQHEPRAARHRQHSVAEPARINHRGPRAGAGDRERRGAAHVQVAAGVVIRPRAGDRQHVSTRAEHDRVRTSADAPAVGPRSRRLDRLDRLPQRAPPVVRDELVPGGGDGQGGCGGSHGTHERHARDDADGQRSDPAAAHQIQG